MVTVGDIDGCDAVIYREPSYDQRYFMSGLSRTGKCGQEGEVWVLFDPNDSLEAVRKPIHQHALEPDDEMKESDHCWLPQPISHLIKANRNQADFSLVTFHTVVLIRSVKSFFARYGSIGVERLRKQDEGNQIPTG